MARRARRRTRRHLGQSPALLGGSRRRKRVCVAYSRKSGVKRCAKFQAIRRRRRAR